MGKIKFGVLIVGSMLFLMTSCLGGNDDADYEDWLLCNAQISLFTLKHDSVVGLSDVKFTIDQVNGKIFNKDSMPYGTVIEEKVLCTVEYDSGFGAATIMFLSHAGDSV